MQASVVIPVWNAAPVIVQCLDALYANSGGELLEVVCVDNNSTDSSAALIAERYPPVRLIRQPVNLGFAGGVNAGIVAAHAEIIILLNQDCVAQPGWLTALIRAFETHPEFGIAGSTIFNPDATINHTGALIRRPDAYGIHLTETSDRVRQVEFVTGAAMAIRRQTWDAVGRFDEGYYPAYYEDGDYCYRARRKRIETAHVPDSRVEHSSSSREWQVDPLKHAATQHRARYRFIGKHFADKELREFFDAEHGAVDSEVYLAHALGRVLAARDTLRNLGDILERRRADLDDAPDPIRCRQLQMGFTQVMRGSFSIAEILAQSGPVAGSVERSTIEQRLKASQEQENDLLARIYFKHPSDNCPESTLRRIFRMRIMRLFSILIGRDYILQLKLGAVQRARMNLIEQRMDERLTLLETLADYDYR